MPTKVNKASQPNPTADWKWFLKWLFILGGIAAGVTYMLGVQDQYVISGLMLLGILLGIFYFDSNDLVNIGLRFIIFKTVAVSVDGLFNEVGFYITGFLVGFALFLGPVVLSVCIVYFVKKYLLGKS